jgi:uncharacterized protein YegP (UPF0339 family)
VFFTLGVFDPGMGEATFLVVETDSGTFRWRLRHDDGTVSASSDGTYPTRQAAMRDVQRVKHAAAAAGVDSAGPDESE